MRNVLMRPCFAALLVLPTIFFSTAGADSDSKKPPEPTTEQLIAAEAFFRKIGGERSGTDFLLPKETSDAQLKKVPNFEFGFGL